MHSLSVTLLGGALVESWNSKATKTSSFLILNYKGIRTIQPIYRDIEKAGEKVEELKESLRHRQKIMKLTDKSEAGWLAVKKNTKPRSSRATQTTRRGSKKNKKEL